MHAEFFLDTNILLYAASGAPAEREKRTIARGLLSKDGGALSVQVLAEFYVNATAKLRLPEDTVIRILESLETYPVLALTDALFWSALAIRKRHQISYWDGAIIAAAVELGCATVYSEDLNHGQLYAGVRVINPFSS
ncbi:MAG: PIN domain-containing protein [Verrucomicrobia bacterium]|nr:PIN domain-containing protein [Verrucomicrobiota bacterium]